MSSEGDSRPGDTEAMAVGFAARHVAPGGRSRATFVVAVIAALVAVAVLKPWAGSAPATPVTASVSSAPTSPVIEATTPSPIDARRLPRPAAIERAIEPHDAWGVRLVVDAPQAGDSDRLQELWQPAAPAQPGSFPSLFDGAGELPTFTVAAGSFQLVGLTAPPDAVVDDVAFVVGRPLGRATTLEVRPVAHRDGGARSILLRPVDGSPLPAGVYQFRFTVNGTSAAVTFATFGALPRS